MQMLWQDMRYGGRMLWKNPGFALVAGATLALGVGANTAIFSVVNGVLLRRMPYAEPDRLVMVWEDPGGNPRNRVNPRNFADWSEQNRSFERVAAIEVENANLTGGAEPERIVNARGSPGFFSILRANAAHGRVFSPEEDKPGGANVAPSVDRRRRRRQAARGGD